MAYTDILYGVDDFVATITLNRPDKLNAWTAEMDADVRHAIGSAAAADTVCAIVLTGAGRGFCAGADTKGLRISSRSARPPSADADVRRRTLRQRSYHHGQFHASRGARHRLVERDRR